MSDLDKEKEARDDACELSIVMPCLNEAETLATCIEKARAFLADHTISGEIIVADNGSSDGSQSIAQAHHARIVHAPVRGYGAALLAGIEAAKGRYVIMGDADDSYDFGNLASFIDKLREGYDLVMGNRFKGGIQANAMPALHRYLGNPVLTGFGRFFFKSPVGDFHCGLRGFNKKAIQRLNLQTTGMEFASEMVVKATLFNLRITEVPTTLSPDGRSRPPHLRSWRDGWRHLRFLLIYSPRWLFLYPGILLVTVGIAVMLWLLPGPRTLQMVTLSIHTMLYAAMAIIVGLQMVMFALFFKVFAIGARLIPEDHYFSRLLRVFTLERGIFLGGLILFLGITGSAYGFIYWGTKMFGQLDPSVMMRIIIPSLTALTVGFQIVLSSFFLSALQLKHR
ncbi:MAG: glycosyltransferase family 2 protein [Thermodesulfovibrionales bacterium]